MALSDELKRYRYKDIEHWEGQWELIGGVPYSMSPAPLRRHQEIVGDIYVALRNFLKDSSCKVYVAPFDVRLSEEDNYENPDTVVQPDISVFCNLQQLDDKGAKGAPLLVVEVLSKSTMKKDRFEKMRIYKQYGVKEYWLVEPNYNSIELYRLQEQNINETSYIFEDGQEAQSFVLEGFTFKL